MKVTLSLAMSSVAAIAAVLLAGSTLAYAQAGGQAAAPPAARAYTPARLAEKDWLD